MKNVRIIGNCMTAAALVLFLVPAKTDSVISKFLGLFAKKCVCERERDRQTDRKKRDRQTERREREIEREKKGETDK